MTDSPVPHKRRVKLPGVPAWAWECDFGLCQWAWPTIEQLWDHGGGRPSPEAKAVRVRIVEVGELRKAMRRGK